MLGSSITIARALIAGVSWLRRLTVQESQAPSLDLLYDLAWDQYRSQKDQSHTLDGKLHFIFGFNAASSLGGGALLLKGAAPSSEVSQNLLLLTLVLAGELVVLAYMGYRVMSFEYPTKVKNLRREALGWPEGITKRQVLTEIVESIETNKGPIGRKVFYTNVAFMWLMSELLVLGLAIYLR